MSSVSDDDPKTKSDKSPPLRELLPEVWVFIKPRRGLLAVGFAVMAINRVAGLILPASTKYLVDDVILKRHLQMLVPLVLALGTFAAGWWYTQRLAPRGKHLMARRLRRPRRSNVPNPTTVR